MSIDKYVTYSQPTDNSTFVASSIEEVKPILQNDVAKWMKNHPKDDRKDLEKMYSNNIEVTNISDLSPDEITEELEWMNSPSTFDSNNGNTIKAIKDSLLNALNNDDNKEEF